MNDASTIEGNLISDAGSSIDGIDASIGNNNASASDIIASTPSMLVPRVADLVL